MSKPHIKLLVTDLDNTLYDWVGFFAKAFRAMVDEAVELLAVDRDELLDQIQAVHRRQHDSERPWSLAETPAACSRWPIREARLVALDRAFLAFNRVRKRELALYPGVRNTLARVRAAGVPIVGHTEASTANALFRVERLELASSLDRLYAADGGDEVINPVVQLIAVPREIHKPDPRILLDICRAYAVAPEHALYVGDSIARDIGMAKQIGMHAAWAAYGTRHEPADWQTLTRVTHWTNEDVARAAAAQRAFGDAEPETKLERFDDLLTQYFFSSAQADALTRSA
jgi:phosphoglycolate phosphatase